MMDNVNMHSVTHFCFLNIPLLAERSGVERGEVGWGRAVFQPWIYTGLSVFVRTLPAVDALAFKRFSGWEAVEGSIMRVG